MLKRESERTNRTLPIVVGLFVLAWTIRILGIDIGYLLGDERINDAARAMTGQLVPSQHFYPPLLNYINAVAFAGLYAGGRILDIWPDTSAFRTQYFTDPLPFYVTARVVVAGLAALIAPAFFLVARALGINGWRAMAVGVLGLLFPLGVYQSHIAKSDVALASFAVLTLLALIRRHQAGAGARHDIFLALAATVAISFKHSFVFILLPLVALHTIAMWRNTSGAETAKSLLRATLTVCVVWPILNIGTVLDMKEFLAYQRIQGLMSQTDAVLGDSLLTFAQIATDNVAGITLPAALLALAFPVYLFSHFNRLPQRGLLAGIWLSIIIAIIVEILIVGTRQPVHLWLPQFACLLLLAALMVADMLRGPLKWLGALGLGATVVAAGLGVATITMQATATPIVAEVEALLTEHYSDRRIISYDRFQSPNAPEATAMIQARSERLARKYDVVLPEIAAERRSMPVRDDALFHVQMPSGMFGLEDVAEEEMEGLVRPFAWPLQAEEWQLDYWLGQDFTLFLVEDFDYLSTVTPSRLFRGFYQELAQRCSLIDEIEARKPLFLEGNVSVFDCIALVEPLSAASVQDTN